jgi:hypothetical protein
LQKGLLAPAQQDVAAYKEFLSQKDTGLIRLLPREVYDWRTYHTPKRLGTRGGGAYYSFFHLTHESGYGSDIGLDHNNLSVGFGGADYGMIADLGETPIEEALKRPAARFMTAYEPARTDPAARCEYRRFRQGVMFGESLLKSSLPARVNDTYLLRSIRYEVSDSLVAFRVVRRDEDGSLIIAWKLLKQYPPPPDLADRWVIRLNPTTKCPPD